MPKGPSDKIFKVLSLSELGCDGREISDATGLSYKYIHLILKNNGIKINPSKRRKILSGDEIGDIVNMYKSMHPVYLIAAKFDISRSCIFALLKRKGISVFNDREKAKIRVKKISDLYKNGHTTDEISKKIGVKRENVQACLSNNGLSGNGAAFYRKKHDLDDNYFDTIDSEKKAYFLGLLFADGNVGASFRNNISITLKKQDSYLIKSLKRELKATNKLSIREFPNNPTWETQIGITISSERLKKSLIQHGCTPRKSLTAKFPDINKKWFWHFIRGYFDGDGCVCISKRKDCVSVIRTVDVCVSEKFGVVLREILLGKDIVSYLRKGGSIYHLCIGRQSFINKFRDLIYKDATIFMTRKKNKFYAPI